MLFLEISVFNINRVDHDQTPRPMSSVLGLCLCCLFVLMFYGPINPVGSCRARSVYLTTRLLGRLSSKRLTSIVHILSPETDNCPF